MISSLRRTIGRLRGREGQRGFTLPELLVTMASLVVVVLAATVSYVGTMHSWDGTATMTRLQRESSLAVETVSRTLRGATRVTIGAAGDSLNVFYEGSSGDSLAASYFLNDQGELVDDQGFVLASTVDSLWFGTVDGKTVNIDVTVRDQMNTQCGTDDQALLMSSTAVLRN